MKRIECTAIVVLAALSLAAAACGQPLTTAEQTQTAVAAQTATPETVEMGGVLWDTQQGASVSEMLKTYPIVFVGHVESVAQRSVPVYPAGTDFAGPTVEGKPHISAPGPTFPVSDYSILVITAIRGDLSAGQIVTLSVAGGNVDLPDGQSRRWVDEGDRLLELGETYMLFTLRRDNTLLSAPWGKLKITGERIEPLGDEWAWLGLVKELSGIPASEAIQQIASQPAD